MSNDLRKNLIHLAASYPAESSERSALLGILKTSTSPLNTSDRRWQQLWRDVEAFIYPKWGKGLRSDLERKELLLSRFYDGYLSENEWSAIPRLLASAQKRTEKVYQKQRALTLKLLQTGPKPVLDVMRSVNQPTLQRMLFEGSLKMVGNKLLLT